MAEGLLDDSAGLGVNGGMNVPSIVNPDPEIQEVDGPGSKVVGVSLLTLKLDDCMSLFSTGLPDSHGKIGFVNKIKSTTNICLKVGCHCMV